MQPIKTVYRVSVMTGESTRNPKDWKDINVIAANIEEAIKKVAGLGQGEVLGVQFVCSLDVE